MSEGTPSNGNVVGIHYDVNSLRKLSITEQRIYLASCQIVNEIGILSKQMLFAFNGRDHADLPVRLAQDAMGFLNMRLLAGRLVEGFKFIKQNKKAIESTIDKSYYREFGSDYKTLQRLLGSSKAPIKNIRDRVAFHANIKFLHDQFLKHPDDEFIEFFSKNKGNMLFHGSELVTLNTAIETYRDDGGIEELHALQKEILEAMGAMIDIARQTAGSVFAKFCGDPEALKKEYWDIDMPEMEKVIAPFFVSRSEKI